MGLKQEPTTDQRTLLTRTLSCDLVVVGGGLAGVCCALTAARAGITVTLIQDRPVLGGNASSEVRLWVLGATAHMTNNNRWAREGGVIDEILVENLYRNPEGNALLFDTILLEKVVGEARITLLLNTAVYAVHKHDHQHITSVSAFCSQNSTRYDVHAPLFCDASGDGIVGFLAGAAFRMGAEARDEFDEGFAPDEGYGSLLGHSIYFYSKDVGHPVRFVPPAFALDDITAIPRFRSFNTHTDGCRLWWIEYGGRLDTVHETETIKWELWKIVYGVWNYIKNSGCFPDAETLTLEWVGHIPGKRESRRFEGGYMLHQQDIIEQRHHPDAVSFGGWSIDLHPADGIFSERPGCNQWHSAGVYQIPYRCLYSRSLSNLFLAGRLISVSHVAFGSTRVMATGAHTAQAVGMAAALCMREGVGPADIGTPGRIFTLQRELQAHGQYIPGLYLHDPQDLTHTACISASSELYLAALPADGPLLPLHRSVAQLLPLPLGRVPTIGLTVHAAHPTSLCIELRTSKRTGNYTPDVIRGTQTFDLHTGVNHLQIDFAVELDEPCYSFVCVMHNEAVSVSCSQLRVTGLVRVDQRGTQQPPTESGIETLTFWSPVRRPEGHNLALTMSPPLHAFGAQQVRNGLARPTTAPNAWVAALEDAEPTLMLQWQSPQRIKRIELSFDTDFDHALESVLHTHPERAIPFCVKAYTLSAHETLLAACQENHQTRNTIILDQAVTTDQLSLHLLLSHGPVPAALFEIRCYEQ